MVRVVSYFKSNFVMDIQGKNKEELISESHELREEIDFLKIIKEKRTAELIIANKELIFQNREKEKRADELVMANKELAFQNEEKEKREAELVIANKELAHQNKLKEKRAVELIIANKELVFQNREKEKRADELVMANKELAFQNEEKEKRAAELVIANKELAFQKEQKEKRAADLVITNKELQQLIQLNDDKNTFFSIITHDLKNPFNSIVGYSELLAEHVKEKNYEKIGEYANIILQSSYRAMNLLMNLMDWAQSQSGRMEFNPEYFDIVTLINEVILLSNDNAQQKSITIVRNLPPNIQVNADKAMIGTVLRNLISNAIKFTKPEGTITILAIGTQNELTVSVNDNGVGISKDRIDNLFNINVSYSTQGTKKEVGTGLGLILCKDFINKNNCLSPSVK